MLFTFNLTYANSFSIIDDIKVIASVTLCAVVGCASVCRVWICDTRAQSTHQRVIRGITIIRKLVPTGINKIQVHLRPITNDKLIDQLSVANHDHIRKRVQAKLVQYTNIRHRRDITCC